MWKNASLENFTVQVAVSNDHKDQITLQVRKAFKKYSM